MKIAFFDSHKYEKNFFEEARKGYGNISIDYFDFKLNEITSKSCSGYDGVCIFVNDTANRQTIINLAQCGIKLIVLRCSGYNNVDLDAAKKAEITVLRVPAYSPHAVAEHTIALLLSLIRKTPQSYIRTRGTNFSLDGLIGTTLYSKTAGIIGTGKIGQITAQILSGFGMKILLYDINPDVKWAQNYKFEYVTLKDLFTRSDIISLHCPLTQDTRHIINKASLSKMKRGAILINTSRGGLIESSALVQALKEKQIAGAALDVYEEESNYFYSDWSDSIIDDDTLSRLLTFPNVLVTSHQAFFTVDALTQIAQTTLHNIHQFQNAETLENIVF